MARPMAPREAAVPERHFATRPVLAWERGRDVPVCRPCISHPKQDCWLPSAARNMEHVHLLSITDHRHDGRETFPAEAGARGPRTRLLSLPALQAGLVKDLISPHTSELHGPASDLLFVCNLLQRRWPPSLSGGHVLNTSRMS